MVPQKRLRATVIRTHVKATNAAGVVCFSCGNAAEALREWGDLTVVEVGARGPLQTDRWWTMTDIAAAFPGLFDATPGHLPLPMMAEVGRRLDVSYFREHPLGLEHEYKVPTGSGETLVCLKLAYPGAKLVTVYDDSKPETCYDERNPLNNLVEALAERVERYGDGNGGG
jgi:hypothetical protein